MVFLNKMITGTNEVFMRLPIQSGIVTLSSSNQNDKFVLDELKLCNLVILSPLSPLKEFACLEELVASLTQLHT